MKIVSSKWVFSWKSDESGQVVKAKAMIVARGFSQVFGVDYQDSHSLTPSGYFFKIIVAIANEHGLLLFHFDIKQAFLGAKLDHTTFMRLDDGYGDPRLAVLSN